MTRSAGIERAGAHAPGILDLRRADDGQEGANRPRQFQESRPLLVLSYADHPARGSRYPDRPRLKLAIYAPLLSIAACASPLPDVRWQGDTVLPLEPFVLPVVRARISGSGDGRFLLDTGSTRSLLDESAARSWQLPLRRYWIPRLATGG